MIFLMDNEHLTHPKRIMISEKLSIFSTVPWDLTINSEREVDGRLGLNVGLFDQIQTAKNRIDKLY